MIIKHDIPSSIHKTMVILSSLGMNEKLPSIFFIYIFQENHVLELIVLVILGTKSFNLITST